MFVVSIVQHIKIDDLTRYPPPTSEEDEEADHQDGPILEVSGAYVQPKLSREEERAMTRESTAGFAGVFFFLPLTLTYGIKTGLSLSSAASSLCTSIYRRKVGRKARREASRKREC